MTLAHAWKRAAKWHRKMSELWHRAYLEQMKMADLWHDDVARVWDAIAELDGGDCQECREVRDRLVLALVGDIEYSIEEG
jgi:hypothetical protein